MMPADIVQGVSAQPGEVASMSRSWMRAWHWAENCQPAGRASATERSTSTSGRSGERRISSTQ